MQAPKDSRMKKVLSGRFRHELPFEIGLRILLFIIFKITDDAVPFKRMIQPEEVWLYKFPHSDDTIRAETVHFSNVIISIAVIWMVYKINQNWKESMDGLLGVSMSILMSCVVTNFLKLAVGRPRPDFFYRCFSEADMPIDPEDLAKAECTGPKDVVLQGYKSFPSGHSALAFGCMAYLSFYLAWTLKVFQQPQPRFSSLRLVVFFIPMMLAALIAASRTCDYHHHWQDVTVGSFIGIVVSYLCYRHGFPSFLEQNKQRDHIIQLSPPPKELIPLSGIQNF